MIRNKTRANPSWDERNFWNRRTYGCAFEIKRSWIIAAIIFLCLVTPATNWMIPIVTKAIKSGIKIRYGA